MQTFNRWLDQISEALAQRKGLLPLLGILLVLLNLLLQIFAGSGWLAQTNLLLHLGVVLGLLGVLLAWAL